MLSRDAQTPKQCAHTRRFHSSVATTAKAVLSHATCPGSSGSVAHIHRHRGHAPLSMHLMPLHTTDGDTSVVAVGVPAASDTVGGKGAGGGRGSRGEHTGSSLCSAITSSGRRRCRSMMFSRRNHTVTEKFTHNFSQRWVPAGAVWHHSLRFLHRWGSQRRPPRITSDLGVHVGILCREGWRGLTRGFSV